MSGQPDAPTIATREQVEQLKQSWERNPIWDLWDSGPEFAPYEAELREHQERKEKAWAVEREERRLRGIAREQQRIKALALSWGLYQPGTRDTLERLDELMFRAHLIERLDRIASALQDLAWKSQDSTANQRSV